ncbi:hypothetical protein [Cytobacillus praedii]|uniref:Uncharacterized protein n=1 Tax=Cytobacillus praedii TaxID=1742358 RepID=A0A4R1B382_9BACI|nr:hypothetical protein [Cytobacillus praedii]TCJ05043.1 hypothetical protein E0Y62_07450 [Cytobacillus praedii]
MRKLNTGDIFKAARIIKKAKLRESIVDFAKKGKKTNGNDEEAVESLGLEIAFSVLESCGNEGVEKELYEFLAGPFEITPDKIEQMPVDELLKNLKDLATNNNLMLFFKSAGKLTI